MAAAPVRSDYSFIFADLGWIVAAIIAAALVFTVVRSVTLRGVAVLKTRADQLVQRWQAEDRAQHFPELPAAEMAEVERMQALWREMKAKRENRLRAKAEVELLGRIDPDEETVSTVPLQFPVPGRSPEPEKLADRRKTLETVLGRQE
ncbi:MAG: hypothetical protein JOY90_34245 [Bradyrhizobium sp.]|uniref:hypothetical protein n=1 Tax=Bradyrhizobium sp. TaxID=376 RepID=UPI001DC5BCA8|nr:hypothetical protein [Bradyrhizobium sp.]MBV9565475.1 hypothetical protein [Bradyrhizobium sp.]